MSQVAKFELMPETRATWVGVNSQEYVVINKSIGCWTLYVEPRTAKGKHHHSSHNTYEEAVKMAETVTPWTTNFGVDKSDFLQKLNELYDIAYEQGESVRRREGGGRDIEWFQIACSIQKTTKYIKGLIEVERKNDK